MWLGQVTVEYSRRTCDHQTLVHRPCKSSISKVEYIGKLYWVLPEHLPRINSKSSQLNINIGQALERIAG